MDQSDLILDGIEREMETTETTIDTPEGPKPNMAAIALLRVKVDYAKWKVGKLNAKRFGEKLDVTGVVEHKISPLQQLRALEHKPAPRPAGHVIECETVDDEISIDDLL